VFEIGPGDNLCSGLAFLAAGARSYTCADRFPGNHRGAEARDWYRLVQACWPHKWPDRIDPEIFPDGCPVTVLPLGVESLPSVGSFDIVCSFAVGEHVRDVASFASVTAGLLRPNGFAIHVVDFTPHDCWRDHYADPFVFLRFPEPLWWAMGSNRGTPNRRRLHEFVDAFSRAGLSVSVHSQTRGFAGLPLPRRLRGFPPDSMATSEAAFVLTPRPSLSKEGCARN
jgi:SAM-dependent methyltransferase